jgi:hypothetical protein
MVVMMKANAYGILPSEFYFCQKILLIFSICEESKMSGRTIRKLPISAYSMHYSNVRFQSFGAIQILRYHVGGGGQPSLQKVDNASAFLIGEGLKIQKINNVISGQPLFCFLYLFFSRKLP